MKIWSAAWNRHKNVTVYWEHSLSLSKILHLKTYQEFLLKTYRY